LSLGIYSEEVNQVFKVIGIVTVVVLITHYSERVEYMPRVLLLFVPDNLNVVSLAIKINK
jgi:hypothetical protein